MFSPVPMMRLSVVVLNRDERAALRKLGELGTVQLIRTRAGADTAPLAPHDRSGELARCDRLLAGLGDLRRSLEIPSLAKEPTEPPEITLDQAEENLRAIEEHAGSLLKHRHYLLQRWGELTAVCEAVSSYQGMEIPLGPPGQFSFLHFVTGSLPEENLDQLQKEVGDSMVLLPLPKQKGRLPLIALTNRRNRLALESALQQAGFLRETLPAIEGATVDTLSEESHRERERVAVELEQARKEMRVIAAAAVRPLAEIEQLANVERSLLEAEQNFPRTEAAVLLTGWIPAADAPAVEQGLREITGARCAIETTAPENLPEQQVPVLLRHPWLLRPFEMLVAGYGLPKYQELEPTLFVAISYVLMFGMMFGDAGQGAVLAIGGLIVLLVGRTAKTRDVGLLLLFSGLAGVGFGIIYGSYFGLTQLKKYALWHDPLEGDPINLMFTGIGIGILMISLGLILNIINRFRCGDVIGGFLDKFGAVGALFYWGMLVLITKHTVIQSSGLANLALLLFLALPITAWVLKAPIECALNRRTGHLTKPGSDLFAAITESVVEVFEALLVYLASTISFVRLAAYAMSHAALLMATFVMAAEVERIPVGGNLLSVLVIILGNLVTIVLEGTIASVQALRLEYYEFFGKFLSGTGQPFKPFCLLKGAK
jgi:V/A-type H+/Na+-transporting ATPase subunit I